MCELICVTNLSLCGEDCLSRLDKIAEAKPKAVILREKELPPAGYGRLAEQAMAVCGRHGVPCILHSHAEIAAKLGAECIHLPMAKLREMSGKMKSRFRLIGASVHSAEEAAEAVSLGASYLVAGHIFATDCKKGLPPRGLDFLRQVCSAVDVPVYAIGGISSDNYSLAISAGAAGACVMSGFMTCEDVGRFMEKFRRESDGE